MLVARSLVCAHPAAGDSVAARTLATRPLDLTIEPGEWVAVIGSNGSGKTALLLTLAGLIPPRSGEIRIERPNGRPAAGVVFQEPETQFVTDAVVRELAFPLENLGWPRAAIDARVDELVETFGLSHLALAPPSRLSGGEMQRVAVATAIASRPRVLLLDEPAAYLDDAARAALVDAVKHLREDHGVAVVWTACAADECPEAERSLVLDRPEDEERSPGAVPRVVRSETAAPGSVRAEEVLWRAIDLSLERSDARGRRRLWNGVSFEIRAGEVWVVRGPNGSGKTTLLDALAGWITPTAGRLERAETFKRSHSLGYLGQFPEYQLFAPTALEDVAFGIRARRGSGVADAHALAREALERAGFDPRRIEARPPETLSLGERRRLALAGVLATQPTVLLLDEPSVGLDPDARAELRSTLQSVVSSGVTLVLAGHGTGASGFEGAPELVLSPPREA